MQGQEKGDRSQGKSLDSEGQGLGAGRQCSFGQEAASGSLIACRRPRGQAWEGPRDGLRLVGGGVVDLSLEWAAYT